MANEPVSPALDLDALEALEQRMTLEPWHCEVTGPGIFSIQLPLGDFPQFNHHDPPNARGIVALRNAAKSLIAEARQARVLREAQANIEAAYHGIVVQAAELARYREALERLDRCRKGAERDGDRAVPHWVIAEVCAALTPPEEKPHKEIE